MLELFNELGNIGPENGDFGHESHPFRHLDSESARRAVHHLRKQNWSCPGLADKLSAYPPVRSALAKKCPHFDKIGDAGNRRRHESVSTNVRRVLGHACRHDGRVTRSSRTSSQLKHKHTMKKIFMLGVAAMVLATLSARAGDAKALYDQSCAKCHGADGKGDTKIGQKLGVKNYSDAAVQD